MRQRIRRALQRKHISKDANAKKAVLEELFNDIYDDRRSIYKVNFVRGIFFGLGSALGGTIVIAAVVWLLSLFVNMPFIGDLFQDAQHSIERSTNSVD